MRLRWVARIKQEFAFYRCLHAHPQTPRAARWLLAAALAYLASPIDLIPDWIPLLGQLDDLLIVPALIYGARLLIPRATIEHCRAESVAPPRRAPTHARAYLALALLSLLWGYNWVVTKVALQDMDPLNFAAVRTFVGALCLFALAYALRQPLRLRVARTTALLGLLQTTGFVGLSVWAVALGGAGKTAVLAYTMPFWTLAFAWLWLHERMRAAQVFASLLAAVGLGLLVTPTHGMRVAEWQAEWLALAAGVAWALSAVIAKRRDFGGQGDLLALTAWQMLLGAVPLVLLAWLTPSVAAQWSPRFIVALVFVTVSSSFGWYLWLYALRALPAGMASLGTLATPVIAVLAAWWQLGERPHSVELIGMTAIALALAWLAGLAVRTQRRVSAVSGQE